MKLFLGIFDSLFTTPRFRRFAPRSESFRGQALSPVRCNRGFTTIELIMVIIILGILSVAVAINWPSGMKNEAAMLEFKHAVRYAQHLAMTRVYDPAAGTPWGISISANQYTVQRAGGSEYAESAFRNRTLPGNATIPNGSVWFNGLGEPIQADGTVLTLDTTFTIGGTGTVTVFKQTGYVE